MKKLNVNKEKLNKVVKGIKILLFIVMIVLIYIVSPRITQVIQDLAKYLYDMESDYITRVVELILTASSILAAKMTYKEDK